MGRPGRDDGRLWGEYEPAARPAFFFPRGRSSLDRITFDPKIMGGRACIRGMRIPVSVIVSQVAHSATVADILQGYPDLEPQDIQQALEYAAWLTREEVRSP